MRALNIPRLSDFTHLGLKENLKVSFFNFMDDF